MNGIEICIICCAEKVDKNLHLGICTHREFCKNCCIKWFEMKKFNHCPRCTKQVSDFVICSNKLINTMNKQECNNCFEIYDRNEIIPSCNCGAVICSFCKFIHGSLKYHRCEFRRSKLVQNENIYKPSLNEILHETENKLKPNNQLNQINNEIHHVQQRSSSLEPIMIHSQSNIMKETSTHRDNEANRSQFNSIKNSNIVFSKHRKRRRLSKSGKYNRSM